MLYYAVHFGLLFSLVYLLCGIIIPSSSSLACILQVIAQ